MTMGRQDDGSGGEMSSSPHYDIGYQAASTTGTLNTRASDLSDKIMAKLETWTPKTYPLKVY